MIGNIFVKNDSVLARLSLANSYTLSYFCSATRPINRGLAWVF